MTLQKFGGAIFIFIVIIFLGGGIYSYIEGWSFLDAIYFSAVTITTLGYGDLVPETNFGKAFTIIFSISGIAIGLYILTVLGKTFFDMELKKLGKGRILSLKKGKTFHISKMSIGDQVSWHLDKKNISTGIVTEIGLDYIKVHIDKKNGQLIPKKEQKIIIINSKGKLKKTKIK